MKEETNSEVPRTFPREKAFYFFTSIGNYTGVNASSLREFLDRINEVNVKSLEFHLYRGDLVKWTIEVLEDEEMGEEIRKLEGTSLAGDALRSHLYATVLKHYRESKIR